MSKEQENKAIVGRWFTEFWGNPWNPKVIDEIAAPDMLLQYSLHAPRRGRADVKNFMTGIDFFNRVAQVAEDEGHHPDLHLEGYRNVWIELYTHAIGGLSENDFILAAKIDRLGVALRK